MKAKITIIVALLGLAALTAFNLYLSLSRHDDTPQLHWPDAVPVSWPALHPTDPLNPDEIAAVYNTITRSDYVQWDTGWHGHDYTQFATVFADDPVAPINQRQRDYLQQVRDLQPDAAKELLKGDGWLTLHIAQALNAKRAEANWARLMPTIQARNPNTITNDDIRLAHVGVAGDPNDFIGPPDPQQAAQPFIAPRVLFEQITIEGQYADVIYDDGGATFRAFFVKTAHGWRMVGRILLWSHA